MFRTLRVPEKHKFEELVGLPVYSSVSAVQVFIGSFTLLLPIFELHRRVSMENMGVETYAKIWKFREMSKVSSLYPHAMNRLELQTSSTA